MTEELRQRNIEVGLISERPPSCMSDNDGDSRAGWMKEVLVDSLGDHDEQTRWLAFNHKLRGDSRALYIRLYCRWCDPCHLLSPNSGGLFFELVNNMIPVHRLFSYPRSGERVPSTRSTQSTQSNVWVGNCFFRQIFKIYFFLFIYKESINRVAYIFPLPRSSWHI